MTALRRDTASLADAPVRRSRRRTPSHPGLLIGLVALTLLVLCLLPVSGRQLAGRASFAPAMISLVGVLDLLSALLMLVEFRDKGDRKLLVLAGAYLYSLVVLLGYGGAFPGVLRDGPGPLGADPSTAPWLWTFWHTGFPVLLALAVGRRPRRWSSVVVAAEQRALWVRWSVPTCVLSAGAFVVAGVTLAPHLPALIHGTDTSAMTRIVGPVVLPVVLLATIVAVPGSLRQDGPLRWVGLASVAACGDVLLTVLSLHRYSLGWYAGRTLTIVSAGVVLAAMLAEFSQLKRALGGEADRLMVLLRRNSDLEHLQNTLLEHLVEGVMMQGPDGSVVATNAAADIMLGRGAERGLLWDAKEPAGYFLDSEGRPVRLAETPVSITRRTGQAQRDCIIGVQPDGERRRWLRVNTTSTGGREDSRHVIWSMADVTVAHETQLGRAVDGQQRARRIQDLLAAGRLTVVVQPIVDLHTGAVVGGEALSRFPGHPRPTPDRWFADATAVGLGVDLELMALRAALEQRSLMPESTYLSVNVAPSTAVSEKFFDLLSQFRTDGLVLELTEHADVTDYVSLDEALDYLRSHGTRIAVDDTGAGFASLRHILNVRPDVIKLDLALVRGIHEDPARRALAKSLLAFAAEIGADIVAEGIETAAELAVLRDIGIPHGQGYHLGRPAPLPMLTAVRLEPSSALVGPPGGRPGPVREVTTP